MQKKDKPNHNINTMPILPDGKNDLRYLNENEEWPNLVNRLGKPRITGHHFYLEVLDWIRQKNNPDSFSYLDAGCGHGNDLRALRAELGGHGKFIGVDISKAEIMRGLDYYREQEKFEEAVQMFCLGSLKNLESVKVWDGQKKDFAKIGMITNETVDLVYMEAVLQASGYGHKAYAEKRESALQTLRELARVCKKRGKFIGRVSAFIPGVSKEKQFEILNTTGRWHFIPDADELIMLLRVAGFDNIQRSIRPHEDADKDLGKKDTVKVSFLAEKI